MAAIKPRLLSRHAFASSSALAFALAATVATPLTSTASAATAAVRCSAGVAIQAAPATVGHFLGIIRPRVTAASAGCVTPVAPWLPGSALVLPATAYNGGSPPLLRNDGLTMGTATTPGEITITPIYWNPSTTTSFTDETGLVTNFDSNLSAASGRLGNVFALLTQYSRGATAPGVHLTDLVHVTAPIIDSGPFPTSDCTPDIGKIYNDSTRYTHCFSDTVIQTEVARVISTQSLPIDRAHLYPIFLPKGVESCFDHNDGALLGTCTANYKGTSGYCAYHSSIAGSPTLYAVMPYPVWDSPTGLVCNGSDQFPNANPAGDVIVSSYSHEVAEAISDPFGVNPPGVGWRDSSNMEIGDLCAYSYGAVFGSNGAEYNQTMNGAHYFIQSEFSNAAWRFVGAAVGCQTLWHAPHPGFTAVGLRTVGTAIQLTSTSTSSSGKIASFSWSVDPTKAKLSSTTSKAPTVTFTSPGTDTVTLTVTDSGFYTAKLTRSFTISG